MVLLFFFNEPKWKKNRNKKTYILSAVNASAQRFFHLTAETDEDKENSTFDGEMKVLDVSLSVPRTGNMIDC